MVPGVGPTAVVARAPLVVIVPVVAFRQDRGLRRGVRAVVVVVRLVVVVVAAAFVVVVPILMGPVVRVAVVVVSVVAVVVSAARGGHAGGEAQRGGVRARSERDERTQRDE